MKYTNRNNLPVVFENYERVNEHDAEGADLSVTTLIDSAQIAYLTRAHAHEMEEDVSDGIMRLLGTAIHNVLETGADPNDIIERRFHIVIDDVSISGQIDRLEKVGPDVYKLQDWKVTSARTMMSNPAGKEAWSKQVNLYKLLADLNDIEISSQEIVVVLRDWSKSGARGAENYPVGPVVIAPVPMWNRVEATEYLRSRIKEHMMDPPPKCTDEERWKGAPTYAVVKPGAKRATRVLQSAFEAQEYINDKMIIAEIVKRPAKAIRCEDGWCPVSKWCKQFQEEWENDI